MPQQQKPVSDDQRGCLVVAAVIGGIAMLAFCSKSPTTNSSVETAASNSNVQRAESDTQSPPPPVQPLSSAALKTGFRHFKLAYRLEGATGAAIYSRNCYDALERHFAWVKLDMCGAFDMAAANRLETEGSDSGDAATYFEAEAAAARYLSAATKNGEGTDSADERLASLQRRTPRQAQPPPVIEPDNSLAAELPPTAATDGNAADAEENQE